MLKTKQFQLNKNHMELMVFYTRNKKVREMEMQFWLTLIQQLQNDILIQNGVKSNEWQVDWTEVFESGKVIVTEKSKEKTKP